MEIFTGSTSLASFSANTKNTNKIAIFLIISVIVANQVDIVSHDYIYAFTTAMPKVKKIEQLIVNQVLMSIVTMAFCLVISCTNTQESKEQPSLSEYISDTLLITTSRSSVDFTLHFKLDSTSRSLAFRKSADSAIFTHLNYQSYGRSPMLLSQEMLWINALWTKAQDSITIDLNGAMVGYPLFYDDVIIRYIKAFEEDSVWVSVKGQPIEETYKLQRDIMLKHNVYAPFQEWLNTKGYTITEFSTEKHGYVPAEDLQRLGFSVDMKIPVPFMVWIGIKRSR